MSKKLPTGDFQWIEDSSILTEDYIKNYDENIIQKIFMKNINIYHFYLRKPKLIKVLSYHVILMIKTTTLYTFAH